VVGAIPVHLLAGIWGTMAVPITNPDTSFLTQLMGIAAIGIFVSVTSGALWLILKATIGLRISPEQEVDGLDRTELGMEAYPEFGQGTQRL
jgi:Amt family ammonium transporter